MDINAGSPTRSTTGVRLNLAGGLVVAAAVAATVLVASRNLKAQGPHPQSFTLADSVNFTQSIIGTTPLGVFADGANTPVVLGGVAFAPNGDPWVAECTFRGTTLHRFDLHTLVTPQKNNTPSLRKESLKVPTSGGCGLTNNKNGFLYSNSADGVWKLDANTGAPVSAVAPRTNPEGPAGNALGITSDPQTGHVVYAGADCHPTLTLNPTTCSIWDLDPASGATKLFAEMPNSTVEFVDGIYFEPKGNFLFLANRGNVNAATLIVLSRPPGPVTVADNSQVVSQSPTPTGPDGVAFSAAGNFAVTNDELGQSMTRFDFPSLPAGGPNFSANPTISNFAANGFRGDLTNVGPDGCIYATQGRHAFMSDSATRYDNGVTTSEDSLVRICKATGGGFAPGPGVPETTGGGGATKDTTPPTCTEQVISTNPFAGTMTFQDKDNGIVQLMVVSNYNFRLQMPSFQAPSTAPLVVTATRIDATKGAAVTVEAIDASGNILSCDPIATTIRKLRHEDGNQTFKGVDGAVNVVTILNGKPGLDAVEVVVNGRTFWVTHLRDGETRTINVASAMRPGANNTIELEPHGQRGDSASVTISD